jgi:GWxTD domain-containing protein
MASGTSVQRPHPLLALAGAVLAPLMLSCAALVPGVPPSRLTTTLNASSGFDAKGASLVRLEVAVPYSELVFERTRMGHFECRVLLTATLRDARGHQVAGDAWPCLVQAQSYAQTRAADRELHRETELPVRPGTYELVTVVQVQGTRRRDERRQEVAVPERSPNALWLEEPQFWQRAAGRSGAADSLVRNASRYYARESGDPHVRCVLFDPQADSTGGAYRIGYAVLDEHGGESLRGQLEVSGAGMRTAFEFEVPVQPLHLGSYTLHIEAERTPRTARVRARFEIGFAELAWAGDVGETLQMLEVVLPSDAVDSLRQAPPEERERRWRSLWARSDPDPATRANEFLDGLFERVRFANAHFSAGQAGWRSDRGRIYLKLGPPDEVRAMRGIDGADELQRWTYYADNRVFVFIDREGHGNYELYRSNASLF